MQSWQRAWEHVVVFYVFPPEMRLVVYTTDEMHKPSMRKFIKTRSHFPHDEAAIKLLWLALGNVLAKTVATHPMRASRTRAVGSLEQPPETPDTVTHLQ